MRIAVIGAGLAGVTTAYELARDGHEVTVFERRGGVAAEGSFAPASVAAPGLWLAHGNAAGFEPIDAPAGALSWRWRRWRTSRREGHAARLGAMAELTRLAQQRRQSLTEAHDLEYERHQGVLALLRTPRQTKRIQSLLDDPLAKSLPVRWLSAEQAHEAEPGLSRALPLQAALHWPTGDTANGRQFAQALKSVAQQMGARFQFQLDITALQPANGGKLIELQWTRAHEFAETMLGGSGTGSTTVPSDAEPAFDAAIVCSAEAAVRLLGRRAGFPAVDPVHVYSVTAPLREPTETGETFAPAGAVLDAAHGVAIARMGERLRVAGGSALGQPPSRPAKAVLARLYGTLEEAFPGAARTARAHPWVGQQAWTHDGLPMVGPSDLPGVWLHCGHATQAWAWAPAAAMLLADQVAGRSPAFDPALLAPSRLR